MKRTILTASLLMLLSISLTGQTPDRYSGSYNNEIGIDLTLLASNLFGFSDYYYPYEIYPVQGAGPYLASYKRYIGNSAIRFGIGMDMSDLTTEIDNVDGNNEYKNSRTDIRLGYELGKRLSERWNLYYGIDLTMAMTSSEYIYNNTNDVYNYHSKSNASIFGGGPLVGVSWFLNDRIKLSTEASLMYFTGTTETEVKYTNAPEQDYKTNSDQSSLKASYPKFLYLEFLF